MSLPEGWAPNAVLAVIGLGSGASAFFFGLYGTSVWEPIALVAIAALLAVAISRPAVLSPLAITALCGLLGLCLWSFLSSTWGEAASDAVTDANRWLLYAVVLAALMLLLRGTASRRILIASATAGMLALTTYLLVRLLAGGAQPLFVNNRLNGPLNYVNGQATFFLMALWPLVAVAERSTPVRGGLCIFGAVQLIAVAVLTQSRGALLALIASALLLLAIVPGRRRRGWVLVVVAIGVAISIPALRDAIDAGTGPGAPPDSFLRSAAEASLGGGIVAGMLWAFAAMGAAAIAGRSPGGARSMQVASTVGIVLIAVAGLGVAATPPGERLDEVSDQYDAFTSLEAVNPDARLASGGGNRYDYWRVAVDQFSADPLKGVGAGNYEPTYYRDRTTTENIEQAHSIELQVLGELGLVGAVFLVAFAGAILVALWRRANSRDAALADPGMAVAAGGIFTVWLAQTSVDWMHLIPGLTGVALCAAAVLLPDPRPLRARLPVVAVAVAVVIAAALAYPIARQVLALRLLSEGRSQLESDPAAAVQSAKDSLAIEKRSSAYYLEAAAYSRLGLYIPAKAALLAAGRDEPSDFVTWGLLGDLETRRGNGEAALRAYRRASRLNPLDPGLERLARSPER